MSVPALSQASLHKAMLEADRLARENQRGGPFGAVVIDQHGTRLGHGCNEVVFSRDPTCHAEIQALRKVLQTHGADALQGACLVTSCECCPMCLAAAYSCGIREVIFGNTRRDAAQIGFSDEALYQELEGGAASLPLLEQPEEWSVPEELRAAVCDAEGRLVTCVYQETEQEAPPLQETLWRAVRAACAIAGQFHLPEGWCCLTKGTPHPLGFLAARWARATAFYIMRPHTEGTEGCDTNRGDRLYCYLQAAACCKPMPNSMTCRRVEDAALLSQLHGTFSRWAANPTRHLY